MATKKRHKSTPSARSQTGTGPASQTPADAPRTTTLHAAQNTTVIGPSSAAWFVDPQGALAGGIAHDFEPVLMVIRGCLGEAQDRLPAGHAARAYLDVALRATDYAAGLTRSLLNYVRNIPRANQPVDLASLCRESRELVARLCPPAVRQHWQIPDEPLFALGDPIQLGQVLLNLVLNARDAMPDGGDLEVVVRSAAPKSRSSPGTSAQAPAHGADTGVVLEVRDNGRGIPPNLQTTIFEPFFTTHVDAGRRGLGLAVVKRIVADHRGRIDLQSSPGVGTTIGVELPGLPATPSPDPTLGVRDEPAIRPAAAVAVATGDPLRQAMLATAVRDGGWSVDQISTLAELEEFLGRAGPARVVIVELTSGDVLAQACWDHLRECRPGVPTLVLGTATLTEAVSSASSRFITPPYAAEDLRSALRELLRRIEP